MLAAGGLRGSSSACTAALRASSRCWPDVLRQAFSSSAPEPATSTSKSAPGSIAQAAPQPSTSGRSLADTIAAANISLPHLENQVILAKVVSAKGGSVLVDPGTFGFCTFRKSALSIDQLHNPNPRDLAARTSKSDVRPGDVLKFRFVSSFSPYGEMFLEPLKTVGDTQKQLVWDELKDAMAAKRPVQGRILNACQGGYAVGVAGYVGLLPFGRSTVEVARRVGVLQDFQIVRMDDAQRMFVLSDPRMFRHTPGDDSKPALYSNI